MRSAPAWRMLAPSSPANPRKPLSRSRHGSSGGRCQICPAGRERVGRRTDRHAVGQFARARPKPPHRPGAVPTARSRYSPSDSPPSRACAGGVAKLLVAQTNCSHWWKRTRSGWELANAATPAPPASRSSSGQRRQYSSECVSAMAWNVAKRRQRLAAVGQEQFECGARRRLLPRSEGGFQHGALDRPHAPIVHQTGLPTARPTRWRGCRAAPARAARRARSRQLRGRCRSGRGTAGRTDDTGWRARAGRGTAHAAGSGRARRRPAARRRAPIVRQRREVADALIARPPQRIKMRGDAEPPAAVGECRRQMAGARRHGQRARRLSGMVLAPDPPAPDRQRRQLLRARPVRKTRPRTTGRPSAVDASRSWLCDPSASSRISHAGASVPRASTLGRMTGSPSRATTACGKGRRWWVVANDAQRIARLGAARRRQVHGGEDGPLGVGADRVAGAVDIPPFRRDPGGGREPVEQVRVHALRPAAGNDDFANRQSRRAAGRPAWRRRAGQAARRRCCRLRCATPCRRASPAASRSPASHRD